MLEDVLKKVAEVEVVEPLKQPTPEERLKNQVKALNKKFIGKTAVILSSAIITPERFGENGRGGDIQVHPLNRRDQAVLRHRGCDDLIESFELNGKFNERLICQYKNGIYYIIDGSRRFAASDIMIEPVEISYFSDDVSDEDILAYIETTDTNQKFSVFEKLMMAKEDWNDYVKVTVFNKESEKQVNAEFLEQRKLPAARTSVFKIRKIWAWVLPRYLQYGKLNMFTLDQLNQIALFICKFRSRNESVYDEDAVELVFIAAFEEMHKSDNDHWGVPELLKHLRNSFGEETAVTYEPIKMVDTEGALISYLERKKGWTITSNAAIPEDVKIKIQNILKEHYVKSSDSAESLTS